MARLRGWSPKGQRCRAAVPHGHWKTTIPDRGPGQALCRRITDGRADSVDAARRPHARARIPRLRLPPRKRGSNRCWCPNSSPAISSSWTTCRPTRSPACARQSKPPGRGCSTCRRIAPSPDRCPGQAFNPIEMAFSKLKALLRKTAARTVEELWGAVAQSLDAFTPRECANYFAASGYDPD